MAKKDVEVFVAYVDVFLH